MHPIIVRTSERRDFLRCQMRWWWGWREGLRAIGPEATALWFGTMVHMALADWYRPGLERGPHPAETFEKLAGDEQFYIKQFNKYGDGAEAIVEELLVDARALGIAMLTGYVDLYGKDEHMFVIQPEQTFQILVPHPLPKRRNRKARDPLGYYAGTYDLVYRNLIDEWIWLEEHKTARAVILDHLPLDPQAGGYWLVAGQQLRRDGLIGPKERLRGIEYNFLRKSLPDTTRPMNSEGHYTNKPTKAHYLKAFSDVAAMYQDFQELTGKETLAQLQAIAERNQYPVLGDVSKNQPKPRFVREKVYRSPREREMQLLRLQDEMLEMKAKRKSGARLLKNPTRDCQWDCNFYHMCLLHEQGGDWEEYRSAAYRVQDPYADHRKSTEGDD